MSSSHPDALAYAGMAEFQGQPAVRLTAPDGAEATVLLQGAHVVSWRTPDGAEQLYLSETAVYAPGQAVRGGVPLIFPQFECRGPLPRHGFARTAPWTLLEANTRADDALAVFTLTASPETQAIWPHVFQAEFTVRVGGHRLDMELALRNTGSQPWSFTAALHTYVRVADIEACRLDGLHRLRYEDSVRKTEQVEVDSELRFAGEVDRIYFDVARPLRLRDAQRQLSFTAEGFTDAVVWNPGAEKCKALQDMPDDGYKQMLCVEAALIGVPATVAPGNEWVGRQSLAVAQFDNVPA